ncbi:hypothetical protein [Brevibacillus reuszeri]|nr:hypothetical protein [Brevibacillus reuszeri]
MNGNPVLIIDTVEEMEQIKRGKLPLGVTDRTVIIVDDISFPEESE